MKIRTLFWHIKEAFRSLKRNGWMTIASISAVAITLLLIGGLIATVFNINKFATDVEEDVTIRVSIDLAADEAAEDELYDQIAEIPQVEHIDFSSRDNELDNVIGVYGDMFDLFEGDENPLYDVFIVEATEPHMTAEVASQIEPLNYVKDVNYGGARADQLFKLTEKMRNYGLIFIAILIFTAVFLISNTIRITIFSRSTEVEIMKLVGAKNWFIRWPFLIEGAIIGLIGSLIPAGILGYSYVNVYRILSSYLSGSYFSLLPPDPFLYYLIAVIVGIGVVIGSLGSARSIRRFLDI